MSRKNSRNHHSAISELIASLSSRTQIHDVEDVIDAIRAVLPANGFLSATFFQRAPMQGARKSQSKSLVHFFHSISFSIEGGAIRRFSNARELTAHLSAVQSNTSLSSSSKTLVELHYSSHVDLSLVHDIELACNTFCLLSDPYAHYLEKLSKQVAERKISSSTKNIDLPEVASLISRRFGADAGFVAVRNPVAFDAASATPEDVVGQFFTAQAAEVICSPQFLRDVTNALRTGNDFSGRASIHERRFYYKLIPISVPRRLYDLAVKQTDSPPGARYVPIGAFAIISANRNVDRVCYGTAKELVRDISGTKRVADQFRRINDLHAEILKTRDSVTKSPLLSQPEVRKLFSQYATKVTRSVIEFTSAHSATVRVYDPFRQTLKVMSKGFAPSLSPQSRRANDINARSLESLNSYTFSHSPTEHVYVPDVRDERAGLEARYSVLRTRKETESELCIRLTKGGVPIGTMNVESPYAYSLGRDAVFCLSLARLLGEFFDVATRTSDSAWLPKISLSHLVHHRIQKVRRENRDREDVLEILNFVETPLRRLVGAPQRRTMKRRIEQSDPETLRRVIANISSVATRGVPGAERFIQYRSFRDLRLRSGVSTSLAIILETLIENCRLHSDITKDRIVVDIGRGAIAADGASEQHTHQLRISYEARVTRARIGLLEKLTIAPVWAPDDQTYHFGMFLLGAHARLLGGVTYVDAHPSEGRQTRPLKVIVVLPLTTLSDGYADDKRSSDTRALP